MVRLVFHGRKIQDPTRYRAENQYRLLRAALDFYHETTMIHLRLIHADHASSDATFSILLDIFQEHLNCSVESRLAMLPSPTHSAALATELTSHVYYTYLILLPQPRWWIRLSSVAEKSSHLRECVAVWCTVSVKITKLYCEKIYGINVEKHGQERDSIRIRARTHEGRSSKPTTVEEEDPFTDLSLNESLTGDVLVNAWKDILTAIGNPNLISDKDIHADAIRCLVTVWDFLHLTRKLQPYIPKSLQVDSNSSLGASQADSETGKIPNLFGLAPWIFQAASLGV